MKLLIVNKLLLLLTAVVDSQCPDGWLTHADKCYHFSHDKETWVDAQNVCEYYGGNLAEVHSQYEDSFLTQETKRRNGYFWIGASDLMVENEWRWLNSDRPLDYANWPPGEPNNSGGNENCVEIKVTAWNDCPCASLNWYICEKSSEKTLEVVG